MKVQISVVLPSPLAEELKDLCNRTGVTQASAIRDALIKYLPVLKAIEDTKNAI